MRTYAVRWSFMQRGFDTPTVGYVHFEAVSPEQAKALVESNGVYRVERVWPYQTALSSLEPRIS